jgi:DNA-binding transcriptional MerR regulator
MTSLVYRISVMKNQDKRFTIEELCSLVEMNKRKVRYYIQKGLVRRPKGTGKGAYYSLAHVEQLLAIRKWKDAGLSLERIREILAAEKDVYQSEKPLPPPRIKKQGSVEVWSHLYIDDGVELHIEPGRSGMSPEQVRSLFREVLIKYQDIKLKEG